MGIFSRHRRAGALDSTGLSNQSKEVAESLYRQNLELAVKNKTLSLLEKLYQISIKTLEPGETAKQISNKIREDFNFERVSILRYEARTDTLSQLACAESERFHASHAGMDCAFGRDTTSWASQIAFFKPLLEEKKSSYTENLHDIWNTELPEDKLSAIIADGHAHSVIGYPLIINDSVIGVCMLILNRVYKDIVPYERESIATFSNVIAVALDKAFLYEQIKESNDRLAESNDRLRELDRQKSEFVSIASHQLRSPLTAMTGYASLMLEGTFGELSTDLREAAVRIFESGKTMAVAIDDFLNVTRIEQGRMVYTYEPFTLHDLVKQAIAEMHFIAERKGLVLEYEGAGDPIGINADKGKVKQIVTNLLDNAIKYTKQGNVTVSITTDAHMAHVKVADTGIGLSEEDRQRLFLKFSRAQNANEISVRGTGLGLFIALEMAKAQGGTVSVESPGRGKGSTFTFSIPRQASTQPAAVV